jgi:hypothetical protein
VIEKRSGIARINFTGLCALATYEAVISPQARARIALVNVSCQMLTAPASHGPGCAPK